ncbi:ATP-dependent DNA helicase PIF1, partial [Trifolium medium]|nr:ATP-dependent DNA helicase PIF1 [Trifolium medium]
MYSNLCVNLSRSLFGPDEYPGYAWKVRLPYHHDNRDFAYSFVVVLTESDVFSGFLTMEYHNFASKLFSKDATYVKLVDEEGLEWKCTIEYIPAPSSHVKIGGEWSSFLKARRFRE